MNKKNKKEIIHSENSNDLKKFIKDIKNKFRNFETKEIISQNGGNGVSYYSNDPIFLDFVNNYDDNYDDNYSEILKQQQNSLVQKIFRQVKKIELPKTENAIAFLKNQLNRKEIVKIGFISLIALLFISALISEYIHPFLKNIYQRAKKIDNLNIILTFVEKNIENIFQGILDLLPKLGIFIEEKFFPFVFKVFKIIVIRIMLVFPLKALYFLGVHSKPILKKFMKSIVIPSGKILWRELFFVFREALKSIVNIGKISVFSIVKIVEEFFVFLYTLLTLPRESII